ncbi:hypothetical protein Q8F55_004507 [Vanrija albida]|uniref:Peptidase M20 dimerisation domain-containing protein n=1 Tax=Vanrija albida TaxID=181172 RepID=A0ABR3Q6Z3_9TREE
MGDSAAKPHDHTECRHAKFTTIESKTDSCPKQPEPLSHGPDWNPADSDADRQQAYERLAGAVRIRTETFENMPKDASDPQFDPFYDFEAYLKATFPAVHAKLKLEHVNVHGLLYTWQGSKADLKPIVLMAHQDVVPVNPATESQWDHPPYSAHLDADGWIWGRGTTDMKSTLVGILAAAERLVAEGFQPERTVLFSFGFDEEVEGERGGKELAAVILERYGPGGISLIIDEGFTGVGTDFGQEFARVGLTEKGYFTVRMSVATPGGHSSKPPAHTAIGITGQLFAAMEAAPGPARLDASSPFFAYLECAAQYGDMDERMVKKLHCPDCLPSLGEELASDPDMAVFLRTTQAITVVNGGIKENALPETVTSLTNYRTVFFETTQVVLDRLVAAIRPVATAHNLTLDAFGTHPDVEQNVIRLETVGPVCEPAPTTPHTGPAFELVAGTLRHLFPKSVVVPSAMTALTDTVWYHECSPHVYRFTPAYFEHLIGFHTVNERIHIDAHLSTIRFFYKLMRNTPNAPPTMSESGVEAEPYFELYGSRGIIDVQGRTAQFSLPPPIRFSDCRMTYNQVAEFKELLGVAPAAARSRVPLLRLSTAAADTPPPPPSKELNGINEAALNGALQRPPARRGNSAPTPGPNPKPVCPNLRDLTPRLVCRPWFRQVMEHYLQVTMVSVVSWRPDELAPKPVAWDYDGEPVLHAPPPSMRTSISPTVRPTPRATNSTFTIPRASASSDPATITTDPATITTDPATTMLAPAQRPGVGRSQSQPVPCTGAASAPTILAQPRPRQATFVPPTPAPAHLEPPPGDHLPRLTRTPSPITPGPTDHSATSAATTPDAPVSPQQLPPPRPAAPIDRGDMLYVESSRSYSRVNFARHIDMRTAVRRPKITALTATFLTMHLRDDLDAALTVFMFAPSLVASDIRRAKLSKVVGYTRTKSLLEALLSRMHERKAYTTDDECLGAACNLLVAYLARDDTATTKLLNFRPSDSESPAKIHHRLKTLFRFVPNMYREDLQLYGVRVGLVYGALAIFMNEKEVRLERQNRMLAAGLGAATAIVSAAADSVPSPAALAGSTIKLSVKVAQDEMTDFMAREQKKLAQIVAVVAHKFNVQVLRAAQMGRLASLRAPIQPTAADLDKFQRIASTVLQMVVFEAGIALQIDEVKAGVPPVPDAAAKPQDAQSDAATGGYNASPPARARTSPTRVLAAAQAQQGHGPAYPVLAVLPDSISNPPTVRGRSPESSKGVPPPSPVKPAPGGPLAQSSTEAHFVAHATFGRSENITNVSDKLKGQLQASRRAQALAAASQRKPLPPAPPILPDPVGRRHSETAKPYAPDPSPNPRRIRPSRSFTGASATEPPTAASSDASQPPGGSAPSGGSDGLTSPGLQPHPGVVDPEDTHWLAYAGLLPDDGEHQWWAAHDAHIRAVVAEAVEDAFVRLAAPQPASSWSAETHAAMVAQQHPQARQPPPPHPASSTGAFEPLLSPVAEAMSRGPSGTGTDVALPPTVESDTSPSGTYVTLPPSPSEELQENIVTDSASWQASGRARNLHRRTRSMEQGTAPSTATAPASPLGKTTTSSLPSVVGPQH